MMEICPVCQKQIPGGVDFCPKCKSAVSLAAHRQRPSTLVGDNKAASYSPGPEDVRCVNKACGAWFHQALASCPMCDTPKTVKSRVENLKGQTAIQKRFFWQKLTLFFVGALFLPALFLLSYYSPNSQRERQNKAFFAKQDAERPRQEQLAKQVEMLKVEIVPWTNSEGRTFQTVRTTWRNNGPKPIHWLYARIDVRDRATGQLTEDSRDEKCIYDSGDGSVVQPGEVAGDDRAKTPGVLLHLASSERRSVSAEVTPLFADEKEFSP